MLHITRHKTSISFRVIAAVLLLGASLIGIQAFQPSPSAHAAPFTCSSDFYQVIQGDLHRLNPITGQYDAIGDTSYGDVNALGFNIEDSYLYGIVNVVGSPGATDLIRFNDDGSTTSMGLPSGLNASDSYRAGAFDNAGNLWVATGTLAKPGLTRIDVSAGTATTPNPNVPIGLDMVYQNNAIYAIGNSSNDLTRYNIATNTYTTATVSNLPSGNYGAAWATDDGAIYFSSNSTGMIYRIDNYTTGSPNAVQVYQGAVTSNNDGANCINAAAPFPVSIDATNDNYLSTPIASPNGGTVGNIFDNDTINSQPVNNYTDYVTPSVTNNGGLSGVSISNTGTVTVPVDTPAGTYQVTYQICHTLDPTTCDTAVITIAVIPTIDAVNNDFSATPVPSSGGTAGNVLGNDTVNSDTIADSSIVDITVQNNGGLTGVTINANGDLIVPSGTNPGTYQVTYQICVDTHPTICDSATATVLVNPSVDAVNDDFSDTSVPSTGGTAGNVLDNDTINTGDITDPSDITITVENDDGLTGVTIDSNGDILIPSGATPGTYDIEYQICLVSNPTICDTATATVAVSPTVDAVNDNFTATPVPSSGGTAGNVLTNDEANASDITDPSDVSISIQNNGGFNGVTINANGDLIVPSGTNPGTYQITYQICLTSSPSVCDTATATVLVNPTVDAVNDNFTAEPVPSSGGIAGNVLSNDTSNTHSITDPSTVSISIQDNDGITGVSISSNGNLIVPAGTNPGTYDIVYQICLVSSPTTCDTATATVAVEPSVTANNDDFSGTPIPQTGGTAGNVLDNDDGNGTSITDPSTVAITVTDNDGLNGVTIDEDGNVIVPAGADAGEYTITYQICLISDPTVCDAAQITITIAGEDQDNENSSGQDPDENTPTAPDTGAVGTVSISASATALAILLAIVVIVRKIRNSKA